MSNQSELFPKMPVIDLFAGPGGLSEGFSTKINGNFPFQICLSIEKDPIAYRTLILRSFYRQFIYNNMNPPKEYYEYLDGQISINQLQNVDPIFWKIASDEVLCAELGNSEKSHQPLIDQKISDVLNKKNDWILIGGPPCQAYSIMGRSCILGYLKSNRTSKSAEDFNNDHRHQLYKEYLRIIAQHSPVIFVMENVKGILSSKYEGEKIFPTILKDLRYPARAAKDYGWKNIKKSSYKILSFVTANEPDEKDYTAYLIRSENFGIPQARHRVILLGLRSDVYEKVKDKITYLTNQDLVPIKKVINKLPKLRSGFSKEKDTTDEWINYLSSIPKSKWFKSLNNEMKNQIKLNVDIILNSNFQRSNKSKRIYKTQHLKEWFYDKNLKSLPNHDTRSHMKSDLDRYLFTAAFGNLKGYSPTLNDFPDELLPKHKNINKNDTNQKFVDRFKVQVWNKPASTITSHISKDSHYFIHPDASQCRGLTVREAARIQTFPDNYFFEGGRTSQYHQVGNAVPPYLAKQIAEIINVIIEKLKS